MTIDFYICTDNPKKINKNPTFIKTVNCDIYGSCNMDNPDFILKNVYGNYVKYDDTYYFIDSKTYFKGNWIIHCVKDSLYTNASGINNIYATAVRNEFNVNSAIQDNALQLTVRQKNVIEDFGTGVPYAGTGKIFLVGIKGE